MSIRLPRHAVRRDATAGATRPTSSASIPAARPSTARPTSATSARSCSPTCSSATCAGAGTPSSWVMNITDIDDKIIKGAAAAGTTIGELADRYLERFLADADDAAHDPTGRPAAGDRAHRSHRRPDRDPGRGRARLPHRRRLDLLPHRVVAGVWPPGEARPRAAPGRRARRGRRVRQGRRARLRTLEGHQAGRTVVVDGDRRGTTRLAHRVLGDEHGPPR